MGRTIAIGDVHGCSTALAALLQAINPGQEDVIVTLGDYIDRGPDSKGVIEQLIALCFRCHVVPILGNHEELLLGSLMYREVLKSFLAVGGIECLTSYGHKPDNRTFDDLQSIIPASHWRFLAACRDYYQTETHLFVHAGYDPLLPLERQKGEMLRWKSIDRKNVNQHYSGKVAVVGHTPQYYGRILDLGFLKCIDTNCYAGGWLTALDVVSGKIWQANQSGVCK